MRSSSFATARPPRASPAPQRTARSAPNGASGRRNGPAGYVRAGPLSASRRYGKSWPPRGARKHSGVRLILPGWQVGWSEPVPPVGFPVSAEATPAPARITPLTTAVVARERMMTPRIMSPQVELLVNRARRAASAPIHVSDATVRRYPARDQLLLVVTGLTCSSARPVLRGPSNPTSRATTTMAVPTTVNRAAGPALCSRGMSRNGTAAVDRQISE